MENKFNYYVITCARNSSIYFPCGPSTLPYYGPQTQRQKYSTPHRTDL